MLPVRHPPPLEKKFTRIGRQFFEISAKFVQLPWCHNGKNFLQKSFKICILIQRLTALLVTVPHPSENNTLKFFHNFMSNPGNRQAGKDKNVPNISHGSHIFVFVCLPRLLKNLRINFRHVIVGNTVVFRHCCFVHWTIALVAGHPHIDTAFV